MTLVLGVDAGASSTRWLLRTPAGAPVASGRIGPLTGHVFDAAGTQAAARALDALAAAVLAAGRPDAVAAGITGLRTGSEVAERFRTDLAARLGASPSRISVVDDMHIAYLGAFEPGAGVLVYAGTGSVAYHLDTAGSEVRAGGHGFLIDDAGAGFWIGRQVLRTVLRAVDRGHPPSPLAEALYAAIGSRAWPTIRAHVYGGGRAAVAALAPCAATAASAGDAAAIEILQQAGLELAALGQVLLDRLGPLPVALTGGAVQLSPLIVEAVRSVLPDTRVDRAEPVETAARLAAALAV